MHWPHGVNQTGIFFKCPVCKECDFGGKSSFACYSLIILTASRNKIYFVKKKSFLRIDMMTFSLSNYKYFLFYVASINFEINFRSQCWKFWGEITDKSKRWKISFYPHNEYFHFKNKGKSQILTTYCKKRGKNLG